MYTGQIMIYAGIGMIALGGILLIVTSIVFHGQRKKMMDNIYGGTE